MNAYVSSLDKIIVIGDRLLLKPRAEQTQTSSGLFLPPGVSEKEKIHSGYVMKAGPGYPVGTGLEDEPWKPGGSEAKYIPLQTEVGDLAIYLQQYGNEIEFENEKYIIVPHNAVLMVIREEH
ncbi:co-chaperone GroES family protein [Balneolaceae bacterium ANBcel3]|nr:co-chaperone GroES family protein [Balneolaceae bacterium ANBcel3]